MRTFLSIVNPGSFYLRTNLSSTLVDAGCGRNEQPSAGSRLPASVVISRPDRACFATWKRGVSPRRSDHRTSERGSGDRESAVITIVILMYLPTGLTRNRGILLGEDGRLDRRFAAAGRQTAPEGIDSDVKLTTEE